MKQGSHRLDWAPSFCCCLIAMRVITGVMQDRDAYPPVLIHCDSIIDREHKPHRRMLRSGGNVTKRMGADNTHRSDATCLR